MAILHSLTTYEATLVVDPEILLAKNAIIKKVSAMFAQLADEYVNAGLSYLPGEVQSISPKISKGEQYLGLPYVMLDYPRLFSKEHTCAIRTFFWWGNFFSIHLQLSGNFQQEFSSRLQKQISRGQFDGWYLGIHESEWHHHFEADNYVMITTQNDIVPLEELPFIKLAKKIPLNEWDDIENILTACFKELLTVFRI